MSRRIFANGRRLNNISSSLEVDIEVDDGSSSDDFTQSYVVIAFYDTNGVAVTPTAGTVTITAQPIEGQSLAPSAGDATFQMTNVQADTDSVASYTPPVFVGPVSSRNISIQSQAGVAQYSAYVWRT